MATSTAFARGKSRTATSSVSRTRCAFPARTWCSEDMKMTQNRTHLKAAAYAGLLSLLLAPALALAQTTPDSFQPTDRDMTRWIVGAIFGDWNTGNQVPMLGAAMQILN